MRASAGVLLLVVLVAASRVNAYGPDAAGGPSPLAGRDTAGQSAARSSAPSERPTTTAFFNYTDYEHNALRMMRLALAGQWQPIARDRVRRGSALRGSAARDGACRVRAGPAVAVARIRHPGGPDSAVVRRLRAPRLQRRQPAHRLSARLSVPDVAPARRHPRHDRRPPADARPRLAAELSRSAPRTRNLGCRSSARFRWDTGVQARWSGNARRSDRGRSPPAPCRIPGWTTTTTAARCPAGSRSSRSSG